MFAVVLYKNLDVRGVIPIGWIYDYNVKKRTHGSSNYVSFYSTNTKDVAPSKRGTDTIHFNKNSKEKLTGGNFYKIFIEKIFGKNKRYTSKFK